MNTLLYLITLLISPALCAQWAVLVAGSNGYDNYRHQADVCHAYQILHAHGIPDHHIIVMMYDDIAYNIFNPFPGNIINQPEGPNVYLGVPKDYVGVNVTSNNFLAVLRGDAHNATGRVLNTGPDDHIFIFLSDHGAPGLFAFPNDMLYAHDLHETLLHMRKHDRYRKIVIYLESCESGSMFDNYLPSDIEIYTTTASGYNEPSYACCFDEVRSTWVGDVYSVNWLENSDHADMSVETLHDQFEITRVETNTSQVCEYGDLKVSSLVLKDFMAEKFHINKRGSRRTNTPKDTVSEYRATLVTLTRSLEKELVKPWVHIQVEEIKHKLLLLQDEISEFMNVIQRYDHYKKTSEPFSCHSDTSIDSHCVQQFVQRLRNQYGHISEYDFEGMTNIPNFCR